MGRLKRMQEKYGIDGFKFDAGEPCFLPKNFKTQHPLRYPAEYTELYVKRVAGAFQGTVCEVRTGYRTTDVANFVRMGDRFSTWSISNGLQSLIPTLLTSGILGFPFTLPDMVGGNAYFGAKPDAELMVRVRTEGMWGPGCRRPSRPLTDRSSSCRSAGRNAMP